MKLRFTYFKLLYFKLRPQKSFISILQYEGPEQRIC